LVWRRRKNCFRIGQGKQWWALIWSSTTLTPRSA